MRRWLALAGLMSLAACSTDAPPPGPPTAPPAPPAPSAPPPVADTCGASRHQSLIGRPRTEVPVPIDPDKQRVACTTCPITMDFDPERLNFFYDAGTGRIKEIRCG